jgi:hypothetical protein
MNTKSGGAKNKMFFEGTIRLERSDKNTLLADLQAIEDLLQSRRAARVVAHAEDIIENRRAA